MRVSHILLVLALVVGGTAPVSPVLGSVSLAQETDTSEAGFGTELTAFSQSTAASVNTSIETGIWEIAVERSDAVTDAVEKRVTKLEERLAALQRRIAKVNRTRANGTGPSYQARASAVRGQIVALEATINRTAETARNAGVNDSRLANLRQHASDLRGPEVAERARNITDAPRGPPDHAGPNGTDRGAGPPGENDSRQGPPENRTDPGPPGNNTDAGPPGNGTGPPDDGSDRGPPDDGTGQPDDGSDQGPPEDSSGPPDDGSNRGSPERGSGSGQPNRSL
jgi:hypothetical protein